jgi:hypothetical protein
LNTTTASSMVRAIAQDHEPEQADELRRRVPQRFGQGLDALRPEQLHEAVLQRRNAARRRRSAVFAEEAQPADLEAGLDRVVVRRDREDDQRRTPERQKAETETERFGEGPVERLLQLDSRTTTRYNTRGGSGPARPTHQPAGSYSRTNRASNPPMAN